MTVTKKRSFDNIETKFWSTMVALLDDSSLARKLTPTGYRVLQRARPYSWVFMVLALAAGGLMLGYSVGQLASGYVY